ncbi:MAG: polysaccharide deacetylase family protein [Burkholderiaceae bacterium]|nr:polysaccharide deacetylase family protein [Burkholderiaceae bacterium]
MFRLATSILSPGGERGRLSAFIFHRVLAQPDPLLPDEPDATRFDLILGRIGAQFRVLPAREACERLFARSLPPRAAIVTFDDGYRDNHDVALPILLRHRMSAAFFIATGYLQGGAMFNDRVRESLRACSDAKLDARAIGLGELDVSDTAAKLLAVETVIATIKHMPPHERIAAAERIERACRFSHGAGDRAHRLMMTESEVRALAAAGMEIGGHTRTHPILRGLEADQAREEIGGGHADLRAIVGRAPELFAYPNGRLGEDFDASHRELAREAGFRYAFTTHHGAANVSSDPFLLPRCTPWQRDALRFKSQALRVLLAGEVS